jgi:regulator of sigma E protease
MADMISPESLDYIRNISMVVIGLGFVIFVHELGHFLVAKACGVKCEKFYVGFDFPISIGPLKLPSRFFRFQWGETEYGLGIFPLGGYVKMLGQDDNPANAQKEADRIRVPKNHDDEGAETAGNGEFASTAAADSNGDDESFELDPRSYPAKPVPARMAIISAGVIMNLIFAVIFATFAFRSGVPYKPCEIGGTVPGSPAWQAGVEPGSRIIQLGENGTINDHLRFDWDLRNAVGLSGGKEDIAVRLRQADGTEKQVTLRPMVTELEGQKIPMLGVEPATRNELSSKLPVLEGYPASQVMPELKGGDRIVAINGHSVQHGADVTRWLAQNAIEPLNLTIQRESESDASDEPVVQGLDVTLPPHPLKRLGLIMTAGPISGIRPGSPAARAGLREGDRLVSIAGEKIKDPFALPTKMRDFYGQEIEVVVQRGASGAESPPTVLRVTPEAPTSFEYGFTFGSPMAVRSLGIAFPLKPHVAGVVRESPAFLAGMKAGDNVLSLAFASDDPERKAKELINAGEPLVLDDHTLTWPFLIDRLQGLDDDIYVTIAYDRDGQQRTAEMRPSGSDQFNPHRGLVLAAVSETHYANSWGEAVALGFRQTKEDMGRVLAFLKKLVTGSISPKNLGGPISIAAVAGSEASKGLASLLIFLTFLSANLAILNFLPIPALDGGHMLFLAAEGVRGKPVDERTQIALTLAGVACLLGLMIFVIYLDIDRWLL